MTLVLKVHKCTVAPEYSALHSFTDSKTGELQMPYLTASVIKLNLWVVELGGN